MIEREKRFKEAVNQGHSAAWDQDWKRAASYYRQAVAEKPEEPKALNNLALALFELREYQEALQFYLRVIEKTPSDPVPLEKAATINEILNKPEVGSGIAFRAAEMYLKSGDIEKAIENWTRALGMNPEHLGAHSRLALVYERLQKTPQAVREYLHIASLMQHAGEKEKAVQAVNRALKLSPNQEEVHQALAMLRENMQLPKPTRPKGLGVAIPTAPTTPLITSGDQHGDELPPCKEAEKDALTALAGLFFDQSSDENSGQPSKSGGFQAILSGSGPILSKNVDTTQIMLHLGQAVEYLSRGENDHAGTELERVVEKGLHHPAAYYVLGKLRLEGDRMESAIRYLKRAVSHPDYALASRLLLAEAYQKRDKIKEASIEYLEALCLADCQVVETKHVDGLHSLYEPLLESHSRTADKDRCDQVCKTIAEILNRSQWRRYLKKIRSELVPGDGGPPTPLAEVLTEASSSEVVVAMSGIRQLVSEGRRQAAFEEALFALQEVPTYLPLHIAIGDLLASANQTQAAVEKYTVVARSYSVRGEAVRAIEMLRRVVEMSPMDLDARNRLIDQLIARDQPKDAVEEIINLAGVHYSLAALAEARKTFARALRFIQQSGLSDAWRVQVLHRMADIDVQSLNWRQALTVYQQICAIQPDNIDANRSLIDLNFRLGERNQALASMDAFIKTLDKADRKPDIISFLEDLSDEWSGQTIIKRYLAEYYQLEGRTEDAIHQLEAASELFLAAGNRDGAARSIQKIIDLSPSDVDNYREMLGRIETQ
jgi:tetratricopeptide (TPR) repeat protein